MNGTWLEIRHILRGLRRAPGFATMAVVTLAVGLGTGTAIWSAVDTVLLRPLPYAEADRLVAIFEHLPAENAGRRPTSPATYLDWRESSSNLEIMTAAHPFSPVLHGGDQPEPVSGLKATPSLFSLLGVPPALGRTWEPGDDERVVVLGHGIWQRRFGGDPDVLGKSLSLDGEPYVVVGVMPEDFEFPPFWAVGAQLWVPLVLDPDDAAWRNARFLRVFARRREGASLAAVQQEMAVVSERLAAENPYLLGGIEAQVEALHEPTVSEVRPALVMLLGAVVALLAIACVNVANLALVRAEGRRRELALRHALGCGQARMAGLLVGESLSLAVVGGLGGWLLAWWLLDAVGSRLTGILPPTVTLALDLRVLAGAAGAVLLAGLAIGATAWWVGLHGARRDGLRQRSHVPGRDRLRSTLVVAEVALAAVLVVGAGLLLGSLDRLWRTDPGFEASGAVAVTVNLAGTRHAEASAQPGWRREVVDALSARPEVATVAWVDHLPIGGDVWGTPYVVDGEAPPASAELGPKATHRVVGPGYFEAMGVPLRAGREFEDGDREDRASVVIVSETLARRHWPDGDAVGRRIQRGVSDPDGPWSTVVGVVADVRHGTLDEPAAPEIYAPYGQNPNPWWLSASAVVRARPGVKLQSGALEAAMRSLDPTVAIIAVEPLDAVLARDLGPRRLRTGVVGLFAVLALALAGLGVYGVMGTAVARRRSELGVRMSLGARRAQIVGLVLTDGARLIVIGLVVGWVASIALARGLGALLYEVDPFDPAIYAAASLLLAVVGGLAAYLPARRAGRVDPVESLRAE